MPVIIEPQGPPDHETEGGDGFARRLAWFAGIAVASSLATATVAYALRILLFLK
jgi:hypothetical protein